LAPTAKSEGARSSGPVRLKHEKTHGALYHAANRHHEVELAIVMAVDSTLIVVGQAGSPHQFPLSEPLVPFRRHKAWTVPVTSIGRAIENSGPGVKFCAMLK